MNREPNNLSKLRARLAEAEEALRAIHSGEVDAVVVAGKQGPQVFTLKGAEHAYRVLIECMNEGALILTANGVILYANQCFARMVKRPLEQVLGSSFHGVLSVTNQAVLRPLLKRTVKSGFKIEALLHAGDGSQLPAREKASRGEVMKLSQMLGQTVEEVQRIAGNLWPSLLDQLGLVPALRAAAGYAKLRSISGG